MFFCSRVNMLEIQHIQRSKLSPNQWLNPINPVILFLSTNSFFDVSIIIWTMILQCRIYHSTWHKTPGLLRLNFSNTRILQTFAYKTRFQGNIVYCLGHNAFALMWPFDRCADIIIIRKNGFCTSKTSVKHGCCMGAMFDIVGIEIGNRAARHIFH